ncbi:hypothetical protein BCV69DRAFT_295996 [Microstroma glucosiphilum]|uniref:Uncharacterized protein n=1 Tax=Pseudomicrostroma glucosiphilum TaxID=1684307 RepID=A0A316UFH1_9BASI|nr:hypothetical protein BCV69DRAFT_295996 [Pseudomicrostroma glucosiphilum]PWN23678.1 hypothetical protein BCV69DRAFT_295996 [Pseudomicrostroma glucosiphilum]
MILVAGFHLEAQSGITEPSGKSMGKSVVSRRSEDEGRNVDVEGTSLGDRGDATRPGASLPVIAIPGTSHPDFAVPISFMALQEDHMVMTFATVADRHIDRTGMVAPIRVPEWEDEEDAETEIQSQSNSEGLEEESDYLTEEDEDDDDDDEDPMDQWRTGRMLTGSLPLRKTVRFVYFAPWVVEKLRAR